MSAPKESTQAGSRLDRLQRLLGLVSAELSATVSSEGGAAELRVTLRLDGETMFAKVGAAKALVADRRHARLNAGAHEDLFADPAWDILLDLYINDADQRSVSVSSACLAGCVPPTTALRWLSALEGRGLVERKEDPFDRRRFFMHLTAEGVDLVERMLPDRLE